MSFTMNQWQQISGDSGYYDDMTLSLFDDYVSTEGLLRHLPTDMPSNASELDTEIRDLVIKLYSDEGIPQASITRTGYEVSPLTHSLDSKPSTNNHFGAAPDLLDIHSKSLDEDRTSCDEIDVNVKILYSDLVRAQSSLYKDSCHIGTLPIKKHITSCSNQYSIETLECENKVSLDTGNVLVKRSSGNSGGYAVMEKDVSSDRFSYQSLSTNDTHHESQSNKHWHICGCGKDRRHLEVFSTESDSSLPRQEVAKQHGHFDLDNSSKESGILDNYIGNESDHLAKFGIGLVELTTSHEAVTARTGDNRLSTNREEPVAERICPNVSYGNDLDTSSIQKIKSVNAELEESTETILALNQELTDKLDSLMVDYEDLINQNEHFRQSSASLKLKIRQDSNHRKSLESSNESYKRKFGTLETKMNVAEERLLETQKRLCQTENNMNIVKDELEKSRVHSEELVKKLDASTREVDETYRQLNEAKHQLYFALQTSEDTQNEKESCEKELEELNVCLKEAVDSKEWVNFQLQTLTESRLRLQVELDESNASRMDLNKRVYELYSWNDKLRCQLITLEKKSATEKDRVHGQLQKIEHEILTDNQSYEILKQEYAAVEKSMSAKDNKIAGLEGQLIDVSVLVAKAEDKEVQLVKELKKKEDTFHILQSENKSLYNKLGDLEKQLLNTTLERNEIRKKLHATSASLAEISATQERSEKSFSNLEKEKLQLELKLRKAEEEKEHFDQATHLLKIDACKLTRVFATLKKEIASKSEQLSHITDKKHLLQCELKSLQNCLKSKDVLESELQRILQSKSDMIEQLLKYRMQMDIELHNSKELINVLEQSAEAKKQETEYLMKENADIKWQYSKACKDLQDALEDVNVLEAKRESLKLEKENEISALEVKVQNHKDELELTAKDYKAKLAKQKAQANRLRKELEKTSLLLHKNEHVIGKLQSQNHKKSDLIQVSEETLRSMRYGYSKWKNGIEERICVIASLIRHLKTIYSYLVRDYKLLKSYHFDCIGNFENVFAKVESEIKTLHDINIALKRDHQSEKMLRKYDQEKITQLEEKAEAQRKGLEDMQLKLEEEKQMLRTTVCDLFVTKSMKKKLEKRLLFKEEEFQRSISDLISERTELQEALEVANTSIAELQSNILEKSKECKSLQTLLSSKEKIIDKMAIELKTNRNENKKILSQNKKLADELEKQTKECALVKDQEKNWQRKLHLIKGNIDQLNVEHRRTLDKLNQAEMEATLCRKLHHEELQNVNSLLRLTEVELESSRICLAESHTSKFEVQNQLTEHKGKLKIVNKRLADLEKEVKMRNKSLLKIKSDMSQSPSRGLTEVISILTERLFIDVKHLDSSSSNAMEIENTRALSILRKCMGSLRSELAELKEQMSIHSNNFVEAENRWRNFENSVEKLRDVCEEARNDILVNTCTR